jgi:hypothetical protein
LEKTKDSTNKNKDSMDKGWQLEGAEISFLNMENKGKSKDRNKITATTWLGDTGASCHLTNSNDRMFDVQIIKSPVKIGSSKSMTATNAPGRAQPLFLPVRTTQRLPQLHLAHNCHPQQARQLAPTPCLSDQVSNPYP